MAASGREDPWHNAMLRGEFESAWRICDAVLERRRRMREDCHQWPRHLQFIWNGESLRGKRVLVRCYHGLGDTIQFVRLMAPLREQAREVILWVQPSLMPLLEGVTGIDRMLPLHDGTPEVSYDVDIELMELPHALRLKLSDIPERVPYLRVPPRRPEARAHSPHHVGISWRSGSWDERRSIPEALLDTLSLIPDVLWYSLQYDAREFPLRATQLACQDLLELAERMQTLDLIISVDTMTAHLAGALALPVWTLLRRDCDWRWMQSRADSPWYPTMRLFRQQVEGDWNHVIDEVASALRRRLRSRNESRPAILSPPPARAC